MSEDNWMIKMHKEAYGQIPNKAFKSRLDDVDDDMVLKAADVIRDVICKIVARRDEVGRDEDCIDNEFYSGLWHGLNEAIELLNVNVEAK